MFSNPSDPIRMFDEGYVVQVDRKGFCHVRTTRGQLLQGVPWIMPFGGSTRGGDRIAPHMGDKVFLNFGLGYPIIHGFLPRVQGSDQAIPISIHTGALSPETGDYGPSGTIQPDQNQPPDQAQGDRVLSSIGGSVVGILRGGTLVLRGGRTAEILLSKVRGLARVFSRTWEHFSDVCSDVMANFHGRLYRYTGYSKTYDKARIEDYNLHFYYADVAAAEAIKTGMYTSTATPASDAIIYKEQVTATDHTELSRRTINDLGEEEIWTKNASQFTRINVKGTEVRLSWGDANTIVITQDSIHAFHQGGADVIMDNAGIRATFSSGEINMSSSSIDTSFGASDVTLTNTDITAHNGGSTVNLNTSTISATNGGSNVSLNTSAITATNGGSTVSLNTSTITAASGSTTALITTSGATVVNGAATFIVSPAVVSMATSGHAVAVTSAGVSIT